MSNWRRHRARRAFTLIELTIVTLIVGILTAAATPKFTAALTRAKVDGACKRIKADLAWARQTAISTSLPQWVRFVPATDTYSLVGRSHLDRRGQTYAVALAQPPYDVEIVSAVLGTDSDVQFDRFGQPDTGGVITVSSGGVGSTIAIDASTGRASTP